MPDGQKPCTSVEGKMLFVGMNAFLYCNSLSEFREHYFTVSLKINSPRFKSVTPDKPLQSNLRNWKCDKNSSIFSKNTNLSSLQNQRTNHDDAVEIFHEVLSHDENPIIQFSKPATSIPITPTFHISTYDTSASLSLPSLILILLTKTCFRP
ncbi:hypothetical protein Glove_151g28 [Diversispora epigaea]|uniref:Uncharacterized protein n=1 Tax=Diversispora epigaea TaxID=1348612 RepID=A0A397IT32_9GLOM|nr:hypothetical protein Glove_151g28 [Diversispora epigaea]